jgi:hypothetical protein
MMIIIIGLVMCRSEITFWLKEMRSVRKQSTEKEIICNYEKHKEKGE